MFRLVSLPLGPVRWSYKQRATLPGGYPNDADWAAQQLFDGLRCRCIQHGANGL